MENSFSWQYRNFVNWTKEHTKKHKYQKTLALTSVHSTLLDRSDIGSTKTMPQTMQWIAGTDALAMSVAMEARFQGRTCILCGCVTTAFPHTLLSLLSCDKTLSRRGTRSQGGRC